ncbi:MAG: hypothetical protein U1F43_11965 [Myxococcota bacterium]
MSAGYSGTPLSKKLGVAAGQRVLTVALPPSVRAELPDDAVYATAGGGPWDVILHFATEVAELAAVLPGHMAALAPGRPKRGKDKAEPAGMLWVAWPKKNPPKGVARLATDISEDRIRDVALPLGLVDVKVCAVDDTWSGLKLVVRKELR